MFIQEFLSSIVKNKNVTLEKSWSSMIPSSVRISWEVKSDVSVEMCFYFHYLAMAKEKNEHKVKHSKSDLLEHYVS